MHHGIIGRRRKYERPQVGDFETAMRFLCWAWKLRRQTVDLGPLLGPCASALCLYGMTITRRLATGWDPTRDMALAKLEGSGGGGACSTTQAMRGQEDFTPLTEKALFLKYYTMVPLPASLQPPILLPSQA